MAIALDNTFRKIRWQFRHGPAGQFFRWWTEELSNAMPAQFRERRQFAMRRLLIQANQGEIALSVEGGEATQSLDTFSTEQDIQLLQQRVRELLQQHELTEVNRDLLLPEDVILNTQVVMPQDAEVNLRQAQVYDMDMMTPLTADQVFYNWRVLNRDREAGQLHFELCVTPREPVEKQLELLRKLGLAATGINIQTAKGPLDVNLLPEAMRFHIVNQKARTNWMLAAVVALLLVFVMAQSLWLRQHQVDEVNEAIDKVRSEALAVQQIRKQIEDATEAAGFLQDRKVYNQYKSEVLAELTRILPQNTYLDRLSMHAETTQMQGKSDNAQSLIELVNASPYFENASFRGPTRMDTSSRKEIFDLNATNRNRGAE